MAAGLGVGLGELEGDRVFRRSFSALILGEVIARDAIQPLVPGGKVLEWGDRIATWFLAERDVRGYVAGKGWAHAIAHGADALGVLAGSPHASIGELTVILDVIGEKVMQPVDRIFTSGEPDRLALATMQVLRRNRVPVRPHRAVGGASGRARHRPAPPAGHPTPTCTAATPTRSCARCTSSSRSHRSLPRCAVTCSSWSSTHSRAPTPTTSGPHNPPTE